MDENNTTPEPNLPENDDSSNNTESENTESSSTVSEFAKLYKQKFGTKKQSWQGDDHWNREQYKGYEIYSQHKESRSNVYDEIVEDLIDIIAKLLKELSKKK